MLQTIGVLIIGGNCQHMCLLVGVNKGPSGVSGPVLKRSYDNDIVFITNVIINHSKNFTVNCISCLLK